ncbi:hypothetical protein Q0812_04565 [Brevundimonas sp. 2R-24]|uniref:Uncharacterized protein n=1 Tax=Peiella sedimenti TaxID=3061083 RepID=A0ABT8SN32_9CAUL|nr:hypothetical protein [Caulobacteraceae bacterium XZ-24]
MRRRDALLAGLGALAAAPAAAGGPSRGSSSELVGIDLPAVGLPVVVEGRVRNYVFVTVRLMISPSADQQAVRAKEPYFRDALVKAGHRTPFTLANDWTQLDAGRISAAVMAAAPAIARRGAVRQAVVALQAPRRRTGMRRPG